MSYDLAVWEGPAPADDAAALVTYRQLIEHWHDNGLVDAVHARMRGKATAYDATPAIARYVAGLLQRWPDLSEESTDEESPWADAPIINNATGPLFYFAMVYSKAEEAVTFAAQLAAQHGLNCFDPQAERLLTPTGTSPTSVDASTESPASSSSSRWRRRRKD
jgi:hypothetical protein